MTAVTLPATQATVVAFPQARRSRGGHHNKGMTFPPDPLTAEDMAPLLRACTPQSGGIVGELTARRLRAILVILYRTGLLLLAAAHSTVGGSVRRRDACGR